MTMSTKDFEQLAETVIQHDVLKKEVELLREQIKLYAEQVVSLKQANAALQQLVNQLVGPVHWEAGDTVELPTNASR
jgi:cell shape-determining protein MreC